MNKNSVIAVSIGALIIGVLFFLMYNNRIAISLRFGDGALSQSNLVVRSEKRAVPIWYWVRGAYKTEQRELLWSSSAVFNATNVINSWLALLDQEEAVAQPSTVQDISFSHDDQELIVSLDRAPFGSNDATYDKLMLTESLLKTLRGCDFAAVRVRLLVQHQPLHDMHLDFSRPWPIQGFVEAQQYPGADENCFKVLKGEIKSPITIILDPAGDARIAGRVINDTFERSLTFECMDAVKDYLESRFKNVRVLLTRLPGETVETLQNVAFANRLKADFYVSLHMYPSRSKVINVMTYYHALKPGIIQVTADQSLDLKPFNDVFDQFQYASYCSAIAFQHFLKDLGKNDRLKINEPLGIPFKSLSGVFAPAIALEIGLAGKDEVIIVAEYISKALENLIKTFKLI